MAEGAGVEPASSESESEVQTVIPTLNVAAAILSPQAGKVDSPAWLQLAYAHALFPARDGCHRHDGSPDRHMPTRYRISRSLLALDIRLSRSKPWWRVR